MPPQPKVPHDTNQVKMPPPKKPKNGPTSEEQFLSKGELQVFGNLPQSARNEESYKSKVNQADVEISSSSTAISESSREECSPEKLNYVSESSGDNQRKPEVKALGDRPLTVARENALVDSEESGRHCKNVIRTAVSGTKTPKGSPGPVHACSVTPPSQRQPISGITRSPVGTTGGSILERMFTAPPAEAASSGDTAVNFYDHSSYPRDSRSESIVQLSSDSQRSGLDYRFSTSSTLTSLMTRPAWMPLEQPRPGPSSLNLHVRPTSCLDVRGLPSAASFTLQQQNHPQQHHFDRRSILSSLFSSNRNAGSIVHSPPRHDDVYMLKQSPSSRTGSYASIYLNNLMRPSSNHPAGGMGPSSINSTSRSETTQVYLHPAFQLPPSTTSGFKQISSTSSLCLLSSSPLGDSCLSGLPRHSNAKTIPSWSSPQKQTPNQMKATFHGSSPCLGSNNTIVIGDNSNICENRDDIHLLDLSFKNKQCDNKTVSSFYNTLTSPPKKTGMLAALMEESMNNVRSGSPPSRSSETPDPDDSSSFILVTIPEPENLSLNLSESNERPAEATENKPTSMTTVEPVLIASNPIAVKKEFLPSSGSYNLVPCKVEIHRQNSSRDALHTIEVSMRNNHNVYCVNRKNLYYKGRIL